MGREPKFEITELRTGPPSIPDLLTIPRFYASIAVAAVPRATSARCWRNCAKSGMPDCGNLDARPQMSANSDEDNPGGSCDRVDAITQLFRRRPHNMIEEIEKLGFEWHADEQEDADEIAEERSARPTNANEKQLVLFLENRGKPDSKILALWHQETQKDDASVALWRGYFRSGNAQLKRLVLFGLDAHPCDQRLLIQLAFLHEFLPMHQEILTRYTRACDEEAEPKSFAMLAQDFDVAADAFGYDALEALRERYLNAPAKNEVITELLRRRAMLENEVVPF